MSKARLILETFYNEKANFQNSKSPEIDEISIKNLYALVSNEDYPKAFDKTFTLKNIKKDIPIEILFIVKDKKTGKPKSSKILKISDITKKALGISDPNQSDQLRAYIPNVQLLIRGAFKDTNKTVVVAESPDWVLKNMSGRGLVVE